MQVSARAGNDADAHATLAAFPRRALYRLSAGPMKFLQSLI